MSINSNREDTDEIHLGLLLLRLKNKVVKYWKLILLFLILGISSGGALYFVQKPIFETNMVVHSEYIDYNHAKILSDNIETLITKKQYKNISKKISISLESAKKLKGFNLESVEVPNIEKEEANRLLKITVKVSDNEILPSLQKGILYYLQNSPYVLKKLEVNKRAISSLIERFSEEIVKLNNITNESIEGLKNSKEFVFFNPENVNEVRVNLIEKKVEREEELELLEAVSLVNGFTIFKKSSKLGLIKMIVVGGGTAFIIVLFLIFIGEINTYLKKLEEESKSS